MKIITGIAIAICIVDMFFNLAYGAEKTGGQKYDLTYISESGKRLETTDALLKAVNGEVIYKCQTVEYKVSKSGTSIGLKNVKKPKKEDI